MVNPTGPTLLDAALAYAARGWPVFPLHNPTKTGCSCGHADCTDRGKHPRINDWPHIATTDPEQIRRWWTRWRGANIGLLTGSRSGLVVIDIDPRNGGDLTLGDLEAEHGKFPDTVEAQTGGGGRHLLHQYPEGDVRCGTDVLGPGIDIKAEGGYIVAPPSLHASGLRYEWEVSSHPDDVTIAALPAWFSLLQHQETHEPPPHEPRAPNGQPSEGSPGEDFNRRATTEDIRAILSTHGWVVVEHRNGIDYLRRPGKAGRAYSGTLGAVAPNVFYVFTTNGQPFQGGHGYKPFSVYGLLEHGGDFKAAARALVAGGYGQQPQAKTPEEGTPKPVIQITTAMTAVVDAAQAAILALPEGPYLFQRARQLCLIAKGVHPPKWLHRPAQAPVIVPAEPAYVRELAMQAATWQKYDKRADRWEPAMPPTWVLDTLYARPSWRFPPLEGIVCAPTLRPDGSVLDTPGYDEATGLYLDLNGTSYPPIRDRPTLDDARTAIGRLQGVFIDFPFAATQHFSTVLAAVLTLVARYAIQGRVPLFAVRSTIRAAGKGLVIDAMSVLATGRPAPRWAHTLDEDEERKQLLTIALAGDALVHIDNVIHPFGSAPLDLAVTAPSISGRVLGQLQSREAPLQVVFFASGNNMVFKGDMARRVVPIDLDPQTERPEERENFRHSPLLPWVLKERPALVVAALTILKAYVVAGRLSQGVKPLGSFEAWSDLVRQALIWAGEADPCEGRQEIEAESDPQFEALNSLLTAWYERYHTTPKTVKQVKEDLDAHTVHDEGRWIIHPEWRDLQSALVSLDKRAEVNVQAIGIALHGWKGRMIGGKRFVKVPTKTPASTWQIEVLIP
jgi:hypothetical protein